MSSVTWQQASTSGEQISRLVSELSAAKSRLQGATLDARLALLEDCLARTGALAQQWVDAACEAKGIAPGNAARAEEVLAGPTATARHLRLLIGSYRDVRSRGHIRLPGRVDTGPHGGLRVQVVPARGMYDSIIFTGFQARSWLEPRITRDDLAHLGEELVSKPPARCVLVLGAGNVSSIPATDTISKIFQEGKVVLLKMNPVNEYLGEIFARLFARLIEAGYLRIIYGGADAGAMALNQAGVDEVHITGSIHSHDAIVWGAAGAERERRRREQDPLLRKPITSELGNVSPWIIVPGPYTEGELRFQAENVAASITNNASFNCVATKVIITSRSWPQRERFFELLQEVLRRVPPRRAYYPGARDRFRRFAQRSFPEGSDETLPWTLVRNADPRHALDLFCEESFVCVCADFAMEADTEWQFLDRAVAFANDRMWGTLSAAVTIHPSLRRDAEDRFQRCLAALRYGSIGVNHWPGLMYAMMSPPWGAYPSGTLADAQSGIGVVHNTYFLKGVVKSVLEGPLVVWPKPVWFPTHRCPEKVVWKVLRLYEHPSLLKLPGIMASALGG